MKFKIKFTSSWFALVVFLLIASTYEIFFRRSEQDISFSESFLLILLLSLSIHFIYRLFKNRQPVKNI